jgi:hypothetical protein
MQLCFSREADQIAAVIICAAAMGDRPKIWDLVQGYRYALDLLTNEAKERRLHRERRDHAAM